MKGIELVNLIIDNKLLDFEITLQELDVSNNQFDLNKFEIISIDDIGHSDKNVLLEIKKI
jgi:hypothetical protein